MTYCTFYAILCEMLTRDYTECKRDNAISLICKFTGLEIKKINNK